MGQPRGQALRWPHDHRAAAGRCPAEHARSARTGAGRWYGVVCDQDGSRPRQVVVWIVGSPPVPRRRPIQWAALARTLSALGPLKATHRPSGPAPCRTSAAARAHSPLAGRAAACHHRLAHSCPHRHRSTGLGSSFLMAPPSPGQRPSGAAPPDGRGDCGVRRVRRGCRAPVGSGSQWGSGWGSGSGLRGPTRSRKLRTLRGRIGPGG
jgi:hypothetical protein